MRILKVTTLLALLSISGCMNPDRHHCNHRSPSIKSDLTQEVTHQKLIIQGKIPFWLEGTYVRNGPISVEIGKQQLAHWFDGPAMLHAFSFSSGKVSYTNKFLKSDAYDSIFKKQSFNYFGFDLLPKHPFLEKMRDFFSSDRPIQNANVNVAKISNHYTALTEIPLPVCFDLKTLDTLGALEFQDKLPKDNSFESAHPKADGRTKEFFNYNVDYGINTKYLIFKYCSDCPKRELISKISVDNPAYMHSFALTEHYLILVEFPFVVRPIDLLLLSKPFIENFCWEPSRGTRFLVINRATGVLEKDLVYPVPFFAFHHVNAYEKECDIILDIVTYKDPSIIFKIAKYGYASSKINSSTNSSEELPDPYLTRYTLSLNKNSIQEKRLFSQGMELPRINDNYMGYSYRYIYGANLKALKQASDIRSIYKIDLKTGKNLAWGEPGVMPGEPLFIPNPNEKGEDEGVIMNIMYDVPNRRSFLLILEAKSLTELARCYTPFAVPVGLHGQFYDVDAASTVD